VPAMLFLCITQGAKGETIGFNRRFICCFWAIGARSVRPCPSPRPLL